MVFFSSVCTDHIHFAYTTLAKKENGHLDYE